ncbi:MAG: MFS transporter, partial [Catenulispora sp.]|nr:MFS transporter [Catenulispora sp.]
RLFTISGFVPGAVIGLAYFVGFTGIWLVLAMFYQRGLGFSPLRSGLAVSPVALGVATSAALAGRLVDRAGRWLTVTGLLATIGGLAVTAFLLADATAATAWRASIPLAVAGLGGGMVTSPNITLSLQNVPVAMAGAAGGALQTAQRIGSAVGTAVLATIFYSLLNRSGDDYSSSIRTTILAAAGIMLVALLLAAADLLRNRRPAPPRIRVERPEHEGSPPCADAPAGVVTHPRP